MGPNGDNQMPVTPTPITPQPEPQPQPTVPQPQPQPTIPEPQPAAPTAQPAAPTTQPAAPADNNGKQGGNKAILIAAVVIAVAVIVGIGLGVVAMMSGAKTDDKNPASQQGQAVDDGKDEDKKSLISNTTWIASDGSEAVFTDSRIDWYQSPKNHDDNYYSGSYKFYIGKEAVEYITKNLSEYGIEKDELESLFKRSSDYSEDNFVVFDIRYDKFVLSGKDQPITRSLVPWYGFILKDNTYLDVANMNTRSYYKFTKQ